MKRFQLLISILLFSLCSVAYAQNTTIKGKVTATDGEPVVGAYVLVKDTSNGVLTDMDGNFSISNVPAQGKLVVAFMGMKTVEVPASQNMTVILELDSEALNEVVVTAMGISREKKALGYAVT